MSATFESFVAVLKRSGLIDETALAKGLSEFQQNREAPTAEQFAQFLIAGKVITEWQAGKLLQGKHKGFFLGKYKLLRLLGKGGMSSVYLAEHVLMRRRCAIKVLPWKCVKDSSYLQRFHREAQAVAALDHPNIVRAYDIDHEKDGNLEINFLVMEYVEGQNLFDLIQNEGVLSPVKAADFIRQGALGLAHAHEAGMVHRDVKPGNFIVDRHGVVKLMDLGLARIHEETDDLSLTIEHDERVLGTADYLAPEQAVDSHTVDPRADLYSLGCTLYYLLVGRPPFAEGTLTQRLLAHQTKEPPAVETLREGVPDSLLVILRQMMEKNREQRVQSAAEVVRLLTDWLAEHGADEWQPPDLSVAQAAIAHRQTGVSTNGSDPRLASSGEGSVATVPAEAEPQEPSLGDFLSSLNREEPPSGKVGSSTMKAQSGETSSIKTQPSPPKSAPRQAAANRPVTAGTAVAVKPLSSKKSLPLAEEPVKQVPSPVAEEPVPESDAEAPVATAAHRDHVRRRSWMKGVDRRSLIIAGVAAASLVGAIATYVIGQRGGASTDAVGEIDIIAPVDQVPARPAVEGPIVRVGPEGNFGTLGEAVQFVADLAFSGTGTRIEEIRVASGVTLTEHVKIDGSGLSGFPKGLKIVGEGPQTPVLAAPDGESALTIDSVEQLTFESFTVRGHGAEPAIHVRGGYLTGTRFVNVRIEGIRELGLSARSVSGLMGQPFTLEDCEFRLASPQAVGVRFSEDTRQAALRRCRFLGPGQAGAIFEETAWGIDIQQCLFHETTEGVVFRGTGQSLREVRIANNTFHKFDRGVAFASGPPPGSEGISLTQNLFASGTGAEVWVSRTETDPNSLHHGGRPHRYNWSTQATTENSSALDVFSLDGRRTATVDFVSTDPASTDFLKPAQNELRTVVTQPTGSLRFIGAVSP